MRIAALGLCCLAFMVAEPVLSQTDLDGLRLEKGDLVLSLGGHLTLDAIKYSHANDRRSGLELDDARLSLEGRYRSVSVRIEPDLIGADTPRHLYEVWAEFDIDPALRLKVGQMRIALGSEFATREEDLPLAGYGFTSYLDGRYDVALRADGDVADRLFWYEATAAAGRGFGLEGRRRTAAQYSVRFVGFPLAQFDSGALDGLFAGVGAAFSPEGNDPIFLATPLESIVFRTPDLGGDKTYWRHIEVGYRGGPFRCGLERIVGAVDDVPVGGGRTNDMDQLTAWCVYASVNLSGGEQVWRRGGWRSPRFGEEGGGIAGSLPGKWELAARYANADVERDLFLYGVTDYNPSTEEVRTFTLDLSCAVGDHVRLSAGWVRTIADHELDTFGGTNRDSAVFLRGELRF